MEGATWPTATLASVIYMLKFTAGLSGAKYFHCALFHYFQVQFEPQLPLS